MPRQSARSRAPRPDSPTCRSLSAQETVRAREADSTVAATLLDQARQLVGAGVSPAIDATRSEVSFAAVRTQLEVARNAPTAPASISCARSTSPPAPRIELADSLGLGALDLPLDPDAAAAFAREHRAELAAERARTHGGAAHAQAPSGPSIFRASA